MNFYNKGIFQKSFVILLEKIDEIRNSILLLDVLEKYNKITKEELLEDIKKGLKKIVKVRSQRSNYAPQVR
jgi:hypothetical protein